MNNVMRDAVVTYLARGWHPLPIPARSKDPGFKKWQEFSCTTDDVDSAFTGNGNVGLLLGAPSAGLVDVDLDALETVAIAPALLPPTRLVSGRPGNPRSHFWYVADPSETRTTKFQYTLKNNPEKLTLVELRGTGGQTVVSPSTHPDGD
jgi:hypothetical protein